LSVICGKSVIFSGYSGFLLQYNWPPRYNWNIVESGVKHHNHNIFAYIDLKLFSFLRFWLWPHLLKFVPEMHREYLIENFTYYNTWKLNVDRTNVHIIFTRKIWNYNNFNLWQQNNKTHIYWKQINKFTYHILTQDMFNFANVINSKCNKSYLPGV
jgi:hypothetical protein